MSTVDPIVAVRRALLELSIKIPDSAVCAETTRRRLIALIAQAGYTLSSAATAAGLHHAMVVRKLAHPDRPATERRPLDEGTIAALLSAIARPASALVKLDFFPGDEAPLQWLSEGRQAARKAGNWLDAKKHSEAYADALEKWPDDAELRIGRCVLAGFLIHGEDGRLTITPTGTACAVR